MPFNSAFLTVMTTICKLTPYVGEDEWGNPQYGQQTSLPTVVQSAQTRGQNAYQQGTSGPIDPHSYTIYCQPLGIKPRDKITLPDGTVTYVTTQTTWNDPLVGDPGIQEITTQEIR